MDWVEVFINQVLQDVPRGRYEKRVRNELRDHMETEYRTLTEAGRTPQEAQEEILHTIGEPEQLREEYEEAWKRTGRTDMAVFRTKIVAFGCILMGILYIGTFYFMISSVITGFYDGIEYWTPRTFPPMPPEEVFAVSAQEVALSLALFVIPFGLGAFFLRFCFREERRVPGWVTAGLLVAWLVEKAVIISISMFVSGASLSLESLAQICYSGSYMTPWFDPCYIIVTFVGCILLGQLFGRLPMGRNKVRAAT